MDSLQALCLAASEHNFFPSEGCFYYWAYEEKPDFMVFGFTATHVAMLISEALGIPIVGFFLQPAHNLEQRVDPRTTTDQLLGPVRQILGSTEFNAMLQHVMHLVPDGGPTLNKLRLTRGLEAYPNDISDEFTQYSELKEQNVPQVVPISPIVMGDHATVMAA